MKERYIFDTLPRMPEGADTSHAADTKRIRELVHKGLATQKSPTLYHKALQFCCRLLQHSE